MNIGIFGATGSYDFGDYAMLVHNIQELYALNHAHTFTIYTLNSEITMDNLSQNIKDENLYDKIHIIEDDFQDNRNYIVIKKIYKKYFERRFPYDYEKYYFDYLYRKALKGKENCFNKKFIESLSNVDLCLFNGGGYLQNSWGFHNIRFMAEVVLAKKMKKPVVFMSNSIGPMDRYDKYTKRTLPLVDSIMIRDGKEFSWKLLEKYNVKKKINGPDDLFNAIDRYCKAPKESDRKSKDYVMIEVMLYVNNHPRGCDFVYRVLAEFIDYLHKEYDLNVKLICFDKTDMLAINGIEKIMNMVKVRQKVSAILEIKSMYEVFELYHSCIYSLSFKYHPVILALGGKKACSAIISDNDGYYKSKLEGAFMNCDLDAKNHVIHLNDISYKELVKLYERTKKITCLDSTCNQMYKIRACYLNMVNDWRIEKRFRYDTNNKKI